MDISGSGRRDKFCVIFDLRMDVRASATGASDRRDGTGCSLVGSNWLIGESIQPDPD